MQTVHSWVILMLMDFTRRVSWSSYPTIFNAIE
jgi:hypothetical protein